MTILVLERESDLIKKSFWDRIFPSQQLDIKEERQDKNMWDFDEKAFDQFIRKRFNLEKKDDLKKNEKEENIDHLNEAALSEAISESLNENATKEDVRRGENRNIDTYT